MQVMINDVEYVTKEKRVEIEVCEYCIKNKQYMFDEFERLLDEASHIRSDIKEMPWQVLSVSDVEGFIRGIITCIEAFKDVYGYDDKNTGE